MVASTNQNFLAEDDADWKFRKQNEFADEKRDLNRRDEASVHFMQPRCLARGLGTDI